MIKYLPLLLLIGCTDIHYRDNVKVIGGFYEGCTGWVKDSYMLSGKYMVYMDCPNEHYANDFVYWYNLEVIK